MVKKKTKESKPLKATKLKKKNAGGRPTEYTEKLGIKICEIIATSSYGLRRLAKIYEFFPGTDAIRIWRFKHPSFAARYAQAKLHQADILAEDILDISDDSSLDTIKKINSNGEEYDTFNSEWVQRSRLRVDSRKWLAAKLLPNQYGDKKELEKKEDENNQLRQEVMDLRAKLDAQNKKDY